MYLDPSTQVRSSKSKFQASKQFSENKDQHNIEEKEKGGKRN